MKKIHSLFRRLITSTYYKIIFGRIGHYCILYKPLKIEFPKSIVIGNKVCINQNAWIAGNKGECNLLIDDGTVIGHYSHIAAKYKIEINKNVLIADKVYITDCKHEYNDIEIPVKNQEIKKINNVVIGEDSWIGENVCILGASIGKHCVIGCNSVVLDDIDDYSIAVGSPARVVKKYDFTKKQWIKV